MDMFMDSWSIIFWKWTDFYLRYLEVLLCTLRVDVRVTHDYPDQNN